MNELSINENAMKMLQDEAWNNFMDASPEVDDRLALDVTVAHALFHAIEEGIVILPEQAMTDTALKLSQEKYIEGLQKAAKDVIKAWEDFNNPDIRVGPVHPMMGKLKEAL